jgi:DNA-binding transcriptional LysR family regulator
MRELADAVGGVAMRVGDPLQALRVAATSPLVHAVPKVLAYNFLEDSLIKIGRLDTSYRLKLVLQWPADRTNDPASAWLRQQLIDAANRKSLSGA